MRCLSFEPLLDDFVEGSLTPVVRGRLQSHLESCESCSGLLEELRVIDALLLTPRALEPVSNFTFKTMAEVRSMRAPHLRRTPTLRVVVAYLAFAWLAIGAWFLFDAHSARATLAFLAGSAVQYGHGFTALTHATGRVFGHATPDIGVTMGAILALDLLLAIFLVPAWAIVRQRVRGRWAQPSEGSS
jgi:anti-sigma factor RsiW